LRIWRWPVIKDVILTAGGLVVIMWEVFGADRPSDVIIGAGLVMTGLGAGFHVASLISGGPDRHE
jgi:hypothetical protein